MNIIGDLSKHGDEIGYFNNVPNRKVPFSRPADDLDFGVNSLHPITRRCKKLFLVLIYSRARPIP